MSRVQQANGYIKKILTKQDIHFQEQADLNNPNLVNYIFTMQSSMDDYWTFIIAYDEKSDTIIIMTKSNVDLKDIPEYDVLQWLNEKNAAIPRGCFVYDTNEHFLYLHYRIDLFILENTFEWNAPIEQINENSVLITTAFAMFDVMQREEDFIAAI